MSDNQKRILEMLAEGKISVDEAHRLLSLVEPPAEAKDSSSKPRVSKGSPRYLCVVVQPDTGSGRGAERVNVRVPLALIRAGVKLASLIPAHVSDRVNEALREKGINLDLRNIKEADLEQLVDALGELEVDVQGDRGKVHVYVE